MSFRKANCSARWLPASRRARSCSRASARLRVKWRRARRRHPVLQRRIRARAGIAVIDRGGKGRHRARLVARQSGCRRQDASQDRDRQIREQVRHPDLRARATVYARAAKLPGVQCRRRRHAYRQPDHRSRAVRERILAAGGIRARRCGATATTSRMSTSAAASAFPIATTTNRRRCPRPMRRSSSAPPGLDCKLIFELGRLIVGNAGILVTRSFT